MDDPDVTTNKKSKLAVVETSCGRESPALSEIAPDSTYNYDNAGKIAS